LTPPPLTSTVTRTIALVICALLVGRAAEHLLGQVPATTLQVLSRDGRRAVPITAISGQEMLALDDLASTFQLTVRDDGGAITVAYKGRSVVLTPDQTIASVAGRLISLPTAPVRAGRSWLVPIDFVARALAPILDQRLDLRRSSHLLVVGDIRVPRVSVRHEPLGTSARVTIDLSPAVPAAVTQQGTQRLLVRFDADALDLTLPAFQSIGFIQAIRSLDANALSIDLGPRFAAFRSTTQTTDTGSRVVIDVAGAQTDAAPAPAPPAASPEPLPPLGVSAPGFRTVAIDAGHGGEDVGAKGPGGTVEKNVTLAVARRLKQALEARLGVRVVMTREDDRGVPIGNRSALANNNKADLFISLHANASFRPEVAGASVYVAAFTDADLASEGLAPERLPVFGGGLRNIEVVPWNLAQIPHRAQSDAFAQAVVDSLAGHLPMATQPLAHAPQRVLESANMPAVLLEMGYLTNAAQEQALAGNDLQNAVAQALLDAVTRFRDAMATGGSDGVAR
jgi:N-acetylmuramoyl-L-alanine amidase